MHFSMPLVHPLSHPVSGRHRSGVLLEWPLLDSLALVKGKGPVSFTRASRATWTDSDGNLRIAYEDEPRFHGARWISENLKPHSNQFDQDVYATLRANASQVDDYWELIEDDTASSTHLIRSGGAPAIVAGTDYIIRIVAKKGAGNRTLTIRGLTDRWASSSIPSITVDLSDGSEMGVVTPWPRKRVTPLGDGWYDVRVGDTCAQENANGDGTIFNIGDEAGNIIYDGDGASSIFIRDVQIYRGTDLTLPHVETDDYPRNLVSRFDTDGSLIPICAGPMKEPQVVNSCEYSEDLMNSWWGATIGISLHASETTVSPTTKTISKLDEGDTLDNHRVARYASSSVGPGQVTLSVYCKAAERSNVRLSLYNATDGTNRADFNLSTGAVDDSAGGVLDRFLIKPATNGFYRCSITATLTDTAAVYLSITDSSYNTSYQGVSGNGLYMDAVQIEAGPVPTSYIYTDGTAGGVARGEDVLTLPVVDGVNFQQTAGTLYCEWTPLVGSQEYTDPSNEGIISLNDSNPSILYTNNTQGRILTHDSSYFRGATDDWGSGDTVKLVVRWDKAGNILQLVRDGVVTLDTPYSGNFDLGSGVLTIGYSRVSPMCLKKLVIYDHDKGEAWAVEATS